MNHNPGMSSRWTGFFTWALVAACLAFWGLKIFAATHPVPAGALTPVPPVATAGPMVRLFGAQATPDEEDNTPSPASDRFQLVGVIAPRAGTQGFAIVSMDNQPARSWQVGAALEGDTTLLSVARRSADFGPKGGPTAFTLELPEPQPPQTGTLADATSQPNAAVPRNPGAQGLANAQARPQGGLLPNRPGFRMNPGQPGQVPGNPQGNMLQGNAVRAAPAPNQAQPPAHADPGDNDNSDE